MLDMEADNVTCPREGHSLSFRIVDGNLRAYKIYWQTPSDKDAGLSWSNTISFLSMDKSCLVQHEIHLNSIDYFLAPAQFSVGTPYAVRLLCSKNGPILGDLKITAQRYSLNSEEVENFMSLLNSDARKIPIVVVSRFANGNKNIVNVDELSQRLAGVAFVVEAEDNLATRMISRELGKLGCYDGAIRIYWPGFAKSDAVTRHPLILGRKIEEHGAGKTVSILERLIFSVISFRFAPDPRLTTVEIEAEQRKRAERTQQAIQTSGVDWEQYALEIDSELTEARSEIIGLKAENENLRQNANLDFSYFEEVEDLPTEEIPERDPKSVQEAVTFAGEDFSNVEILISAFDAASKSPFVRPKEVYEALSIMSAVCTKWSENRTNNVTQMLREAGLGRRVTSFISSTTESKHGDEYTFNYNGTRTLFEPHITLGSGSANTCLSIHYILDEDKACFVVAHIGRHLTNTRT
ncbi:hypothetical protein [Methylobacterium sp. EM32]|uniref:hypothetical protein n=1 Tax=Methylobacterium sp. EM32 TaxID=3163481 RepID=UPI0033A19E15